MKIIKIENYFECPLVDWSEYAGSRYVKCLLQPNIIGITEELIKDIGMPELCPLEDEEETGKPDEEEEEEYPSISKEFLDVLEKYYGQMPEDIGIVVFGKRLWSNLR